MVAVTWIGDEDPSKQVITHHGHVFVKGEPTSVPAKDPYLGKLRTNAMFVVGKGGDAVESDEPEPVDLDEGSELASVKADLDELGVVYQPNTGLAKLREKLAAALG